MVKLFISYRRSDSETQTRRIAQRLKRHFDDENVVLDTDNFRLGYDFRNELMDHLLDSQVVLAVIGEFWHSILIDKLNDPSRTGPDWVMEEIETAIRERKLLIPITLDGIFIPPALMLPPSIQPLSVANGMNLRTSSYWFDEDIQRLIHRIEVATGTFVIPQSGTMEYLWYLLRNSEWEYSSIDGNDSYLCQRDNTYRIVEDLTSEEAEDNYTSEWVDHFPGTHRTYPVVIKHNGQEIARTYFVSVWGAKYFVPIAMIGDSTPGNPIYYWDVHSLEVQLARLISRWDNLYESLEDFARVAHIEIRE